MLAEERRRRAASEAALEECHAAVGQAAALRLKIAQEEKLALSAKVGAAKAVVTEP